jgi:hypothetical protein
MYASISPMRAQRDPLPFRVLETGERVDASAMGTPGITLQFDPRAEYMPKQLNEVNQILDVFRDYFTDADPWGSSMTWLGIVVTVLKKKFGEHAPAHWRGEVRPAEAGVIDELVSSLSPAELHKQLLFAGEVMNRLATAAWLENKDYPLKRSKEAGSSEELEPA